MTSPRAICESGFCEMLIYRHGQDAWDALPRASTRFKAGVSALLALIVIVVSMMAAVPAAHADDDPSEDDFSLYAVASSAASYYEQTHMKGAGDDKEWRDSSMSVGNAGGLVGFRDQNYNKGIIGFFSSFSSSDQAMNYQSFERSTTGDSTNNTGEQKIAAYARYGRALNYLTLDQATGNGFMDAIVRAVATVPMMAAYTMVAFVEGILFTSLTSVLQWFNPFTWLGMSHAMDCSGSICSTAKDLNPDQGANGTPNMFTQMISTAYSTMYDIGWALIPIFLGLCITFVIINANTRKPRQGEATTASRIKTFVIRLVFITIGIPALAIMYGTALNYMTTTNSVAMNANYILGSNYVDFENWAYKHRLALPSGDTLVVDYSNDNPAGTVNTAASTTLRKLTADINAMSNSSFKNFMDSDDIETKARSNSADDLFNNYTASGDVSIGDKNTSTSSNLMSDTISRMVDGYDMLIRYMSRSVMSGASYETYLKGHLGSSQDQNGAGHSNMETLNENIKTIQKDKIDYFTKENCGTSEAGGCFLANAREGGRPFIFTNGYLDTEEIHDGQSTSRLKYTNGSSQYGLSDLAMYNYLTSSFDASQVKVYSAKKMSSFINSTGHYSVNQVGVGFFNSMCMWFNTLVLLLAVGLVGLVYFLAIIINNIKRSFKLIMSTFTAALGSVKAIVRVVMLTLMLIIEIFATLVLYVMVTMILVNISSIVEQTIMKGGTMFTTILSAPMIYSFMLLFTSIFIVCLMIMALKVRKEFVQSVDQAVAGILDKVFGTSGASGVATPAPKGPGLVKQAASGLARGAGMAGMAGLMNSDKMGALGEKVKEGLGKAAGGGSAPGDTYGGGNGVAPAGGAGGVDSKDGTAAGDNAGNASGSSEAMGAKALENGGIDFNGSGDGASNAPTAANELNAAAKAAGDVKTLAAASNAPNVNSSNTVNGSGESAAPNVNVAQGTSGAPDKSSIFAVGPAGETKALGAGPNGAGHEADGKGPNSPNGNGPSSIHGVAPASSTQAGNNAHETPRGTEGTRIMDVGSKDAAQQLGEEAVRVVQQAMPSPAKAADNLSAPARVNEPGRVTNVDKADQVYRQPAGQQPPTQVNNSTQVNIDADSGNLKPTHTLAQGDPSHGRVENA